MSKLNLIAGLWRLWMLLAASWIVLSAFILKEDLFSIKQDSDWIDVKSGLPSMVANWPLRIQALEYVFLPPFGLLLLGLGIIWVVKGFRRPF